jgi:hypothetical protein
MWDFSWLERRWPGAGYEDWHRALGELVERGYDAVRIDAYPHLIAANSGATWELIPAWSTQDWGSPPRTVCRCSIEMCAEWSPTTDKPLITTECWGLVDYKDWPLLEWDWIKDLCELGVRTAAKTGRWVAIATSNFAGPQFRGMWRDAEWHRKITSLIHSSPIRL